jgi:hypothetical protein
MSSLEHAHRALIAQLAALAPRPIVGFADAADVEARTDHLQAVFKAVIEYEQAAITDTVDHLAAVRNHRGEVVDLLWDSINEDPDWDIVAALSRAGCSLGFRAAA